MSPLPSNALLLDTTVVIDILRNRNQRRAWVEQFVLAGGALAISVISIAEVYAGLRAGEEPATRALLANLEWLAISPAIAERAGFLKAGESRQGRTHSLLDMMIAATAIEYECPLATDNQRHFQIPEVRLVPLPR